MVVRNSFAKARHVWSTNLIVFLKISVIGQSLSGGALAGVCHLEITNTAAFLKNSWDGSAVVRERAHGGAPRRECRYNIICVIINK